MAVSRTVPLDDLLPHELAQIFAGYDSDQQADFFSCVAFQTRGWPGTGWCGQACAIAEKIDDYGKSVVLKLADHINHRNAQ